MSILRLKTISLIVLHNLSINDNDVCVPGIDGTYVIFLFCKYFLKPSELIARSPSNLNRLTLYLDKCLLKAFFNELIVF